MLIQRYGKGRGKGHSNSNSFRNKSCTSLQNKQLQQHDAEHTSCYKHAYQTRKGKGGGKTAFE